MIFVFWSMKHGPTSEWIGDAETGTLIRATRWYDARKLYTKLTGSLPIYWESYADGNDDAFDYEVEWHGHAATSMHNLNAFYRKMGSRKWQTL